MPTIIGQEVAPDFDGRPRRISSEDFDIWHRFRTSNLYHPVRLLFDVGVGIGKSELPGVPDEWREHWLHQTQRRIDVLIIEEHRQIIVELRKRALANALGRLLVYKQLYLDDPIVDLPIEFWLVTDTTDPELAALFLANGIRWITL